MKDPKLGQIDAVGKWLQSRGLVEATIDSQPIDSSNVIRLANMGELSIGLPMDSFRRSPANENGIFWFPHGIPSGESVALVSSRLGKKLDEQDGLFDAVRTFCCRMDRDAQFLVSHDNTTTFATLLRAAELFQIPFIEFRRFPKQFDSEWCAVQMNNLDATHVVFYDFINRHRRIDEFQIDRFLIETCCEVRALNVRKGGNIFIAVMNRLSQNHLSKVFVAQYEAKSGAQFEKLTEKGAVGWYLFRDETELAESIDASGSAENIIGLNEFKKQYDLNDFLTHWTRRCDGPWPNQSLNQYQDELLLRSPLSKHDRIATLVKILADQTLIASKNVTRDQRPVVCFTEVAVEELVERRTFRSHLNRWDFETVGIAIKKQVLKNLGAQKVIYGTESCWQALDDSVRPYFQKSDGKIDWSFEKEWRIASNVNLAEINIKDAFVFVDCENDARKVASFTNLPIVVLSRSEN